MDYISKTENSVLMTQARESLRGQWGKAIGPMIVYLLIISGGSSIPKAGSLISLIISGPMSLGLILFCTSLSRNQDPQFSQIFDGFKKFGVALGAYLLQTVFILLWCLLLIVPGIIAALSYSMTFFIIAEDDSIGPMDAIKKSKEMMMGNKWKLFCLGWRFFGWFILCLLTMGIGLLWFMPYTTVSFLRFYEDVKKEIA